MTTVADLIEECFNHLYGGYRQTYNVLDGAHNASTTSIILTYPPDSTGPGSFLAIDDELVYVITIDRSTKTATVIRGQRGSTAATHADGALVEVNPRFPRFRVKAKLQEEIRSWPESVYRTTAVNLDTTSGTNGYDLTGIGSDFHNVLDVQLGPPNGSTHVDWTRVGYQVVRDADTAAFASGTGLIITGILPVESRDFRVIVSRPFDVDTWDDSTDLEDDCGLPASMHDIPPLGAAQRLMTGRDVVRSFGEGQGEPRHAEEVPPGFAGSIASFLLRQRDRRLSEEALKLAGRNPIRM